MKVYIPPERRNDGLPPTKEAGPFRNRPHKTKPIKVNAVVPARLLGVHGAVNPLAGLSLRPDLAGRRVEPLGRYADFRRSIS